MLLLVEGFIHQKETEYKMGMTTAWMAAAWGRAKRMPTLSKVIADFEKRKRPPKSTEEQQSEFFDLAKSMAPDLPTVNEVVHDVKAIDVSSKTEELPEP